MKGLSLVYNIPGIQAGIKCVCHHGATPLWVFSISVGMTYCNCTDSQLFGKAPNVAQTTHLILPIAKAFVEAVSVVFQSSLAREH